MSVRFLATCFIHSPFGSEVIPPMHTQRVAISMCDFKFEAHHSLEPMETFLRCAVAESLAGP